MARHAEAVPILHYALLVAGREFLLTIHADGSSHWDDHSERRNLRHPRDRYLELAAFAGDAAAFRRLQHECMEFTIDAPVTKEILLKASEVAVKDSRGGSYVARTMAREIAEMDSLLTEFFWKAINPQLGRPIQPERP